MAGVFDRLRMNDKAGMFGKLRMSFDKLRMNDFAGLRFVKVRWGAGAVWFWGL